MKDFAMEMTTHLHALMDKLLTNFTWPYFYVVGEPLNSEAWQWYHTVAGREKCTVVDTWFQTGKVWKKGFI